MKEPFLIDLDKLTQEQFDRAMATPEGSCRYSSPCIIGAMMPDELINRLELSMLDKMNIVSLADQNIVCFTSESEKKRVITLQRLFDGRPEPYFGVTFAQSLRKLLPHINVV